MKNTLKLELRKALINKLFFGAIIILFIPSLMSFLYRAGSYELEKEYLENAAKIFGENYENPQLGGRFTLSNNWVGGESYTLGSSIFFYIFPLLLAIPYGWSYCSELKSGYIKNMLIRTKRTPYFLSKYIAVFVASGLVMVIPMIANIIMTACYFPATLPNVGYDIFHGIFPYSLMSEIYYTHPILYIILYLLLDFFFCGLIGCLSYAITTVIKNRIVVVLVPFAILLAWHYFSVTLSIKLMKAVSPLEFLHPTTLNYGTTWFIVGIEAIILFAVTFIPTVVRGRRYEIY
jgi:ABC-type transport system involved in multi-copper enzyme maturation permease subunit